MSYEAVDLGGTPIVVTTPVVVGPRGPAALNNIDGGHARSIYSPGQNIECGGA